MSKAATAAERRYINLPKPAGLPFSDAVLAGNTLYLSGRIGFDPATGKVPADPKQEARFLLEGFKAVLAEAGMTMDDVVYVTIYCPDVSHFDTFNSVYTQYFKGELPARAFLGSGPLLFNARFEMLATAVKR